MMPVTSWVLVLLASVVCSSPVSSRGGRTSIFTYPKLATSADAGYRSNTSALPLFNGIAVQDSWAGRVEPEKTSGAGLRLPGCSPGPTG